MGRLFGHAADRPLVRAARLRRSPADGRTIAPTASCKKITSRVWKTATTPRPRFTACCSDRSARRPASCCSIAALLAYGYLLFELFRLDTIARHRLGVVLILFLFCLLFFAFFEQAGSSMNNFTDRNVERVFGGKDAKVITAADVGKTIKIEPTQKQLGYHNGDRLFTLDVLSQTSRGEQGPRSTSQIDWKVANDNVGMTIAHRDDEIRRKRVPVGQLDLHSLAGPCPFRPCGRSWARTGLSRARRSSSPSGLLQLGLGFVALWYGARTADARGMVGVEWLLLAYLLHTTGELCLSPVGLSMITKLSPAHLVSTVIGGWFLTTAMAEFLSGMIAQFTRVGGEGEPWCPPRSKRFTSMATFSASSPSLPASPRCCASAWFRC